MEITNMPYIPGKVASDYSEISTMTAIISSKYFKRIDTRNDRDDMYVPNNNGKKYLIHNCRKGLIRKAKLLHKDAVLSCHISIASACDESDTNTVAYCLATGTAVKLTDKNSGSDDSNSASKITNSNNGSEPSSADLGKAVTYGATMEKSKFIKQLIGLLKTTKPTKKSSSMIDNIIKNDEALNPNKIMNDSQSLNHSQN